MPPRHVRARDFKREEKIVELTKERKESKKATASGMIPIDPTIPSWDTDYTNPKIPFWRPLTSIEWLKLRSLQKPEQRNTMKPRMTTRGPLSNFRLMQQATLL